jgi:glycosyltransferase involved in cell wall biosynthesis
LFFLPTLGENYGHSIAEAMLSGVPVLIADTTPWRDLTALKLGADLPLNNPKAFADFISTLVSLDQQGYIDSFGKVASVASALIHLPLTIEGYKALFE